MMQSCNYAPHSYMIWY